MDDVDSMGPDLQPVVVRFLNFLLGKVPLQFILHGMSIFHDIQMATYFGTGWCYSHMVGYAGSPTYTAYVDMTLTRSKVKVKVTRLLNFPQLAKPCMLAAMTAAPLRGFLVVFPILPSSARVICGRILKRFLIGYFIGRICAKNIKIHSRVSQL